MQGIKVSSIMRQVYNTSVAGVPAAFEAAYEEAILVTTGENVSVLSLVPFHRSASTAPPCSWAKRTHLPACLDQQFGIAYGRQVLVEHQHRVAASRDYPRAVSYTHLTLPTTPYV